MPPKKSKGGLDIVPGDGRTKQQQEEEELKKMQEMMQQMFNTTHTTKPKPTKNKKAVAQRHKNDESLAQKRAAADRVGQRPIGLQHVQQIAERFPQKAGVVTHILGGRVDLVRDAGRKLTD